MFGRIKINATDRLFSEYIRKKANGKCERCKREFGWKNLENSHFHGRRKKSVRWDETNCAALCRACHQYYTENPHAHTEFFKKRLGEEKFNALAIRANLARKPDENLVRIYFREILKRM